jgi:PAS domain S-box-containing protein
MADADKTKEQMMNELQKQRQRIAELETSEAERRRVEAALRTTLYSIGDAVIATDANGYVAIMNAVAERLTGYGEEEARGMPLERVFNIVNEETRRKVESPVKRVLREGVVVGLANHTLLIARDGTERPIADSGAPIFDKDGNITGVVIVFRDQTEQRRAQREIEEARAYAESIVATVREPLVILDAELRVVSANRSFYETFRVSPGETEGQLFCELGNRQWDIPKLRGLLEDILPKNTTIEDFEVEHDFPTIGRRAMLLNARQIYWQLHKAQMILLAIDDITERKRLQQREKEAAANRMAAQVLEGMLEAVTILDLDGIIRQVNNGFERSTGWKREEVIGKTSIEVGFLSEEEGQRIEKEVLPTLMKEGSVRNFETTVVRRNGTNFPVLMSWTLMKDVEGKPTRIVTAATDITQRKQAEEMLRESEERYRALVQLGAEVGEAVVMLQDTEQGEGVQTFVSDEWLHITGYSREELLGKPFFDLVSPRHRGASVERHRRKMSGEAMPGLYEMTIIRKDGAEVPVELTSAYTTYKGTKANVAYIRDITERKRAEEALRQAEENFRRSLDDSPLGIRIVTAEGETLYANRAILDLYGYGSLEELHKTPTKERYTPESYAEHQERKERRKRGDYVPSNYEISIVRKDGETRHLSVSRGEVIWNGERQFQSTYQDVTERKHAEEEIKHLNLTLRAIRNVNQLISREKDRKRLLQEICRLLTETRSYSNAWIALLNESGKLLAHAEVGWGKDFAPMLERLKLGELPICGRQALGQASVVVSGKPASTCAGCPLSDKLSPNGALTVRLEHAGKVYGLLNASVPSAFITDEQIALFQEVANDIAFALHDIELEEKNRLAMRALQWSEEKYRDLYDNAPIPYFSVDTRGIIRECNKAAHLWLGYEPGELIGKTRLEVYAEESKSKAKDLFEKLKRGITIEDEEMTFVRKDGQNVYGLLSMNAIRDENGRVIANRGVVIDITERKRLEQALAAEKERLEVTLRSTGDGVISTDLEGKVMFLNRVAEELTGWTQEEAVGKPLREVFHIIDERSRKQVGNPVEKVLKTGRIIGLINHAVLISRDGTERIIADSGAPVRDEEGNLFGVVMVFRDITEIRKLEEEVQKVEKLQSIGTLAGGIAHDFNNILTGILGNITLAEKYIEPEGKAAERLLEARKASMRAKDLTQQLLTFSKGGAPIKKTASIAELTRESATFALRGSNAKCEFYLPGDLWPAEVDEGQINQVITNLVINADEAMPKGGILHIRAKNTTIKRKGALPLAKGKYVEITIEDHGIGIPKEDLDRIFEPYFTTKQKGSGLGLATSYSIIKNHDGYITVESELGVGTTFHVYLPASEKPALEKKEAAKEVPVRGQGRILVMDDEEIIREMLSSMLSTAGYEATLTIDGAEAIERYAKAKDSGQPFDAVILDLTVAGGMGGKETIRKLLEIDPDVKAVVSSGYSTDPIMADFKKYGFSAVVTKPYSVGELEKTLRSILGQGKRAI